MTYKHEEEALLSESGVTRVQDSKRSSIGGVPAPAPALVVVVARKKSKRPKERKKRET